jgi:hypothetical protein
MKQLLSLGAVFSLALGASVSAASLRFSPCDSPTGIYSLYLNGGADNGNFDTIIVDINPSPGAQLLNPHSGAVGGSPRPPGDAFTYINRLINASPDDVPGGLGWTVLGLTPVAEMANGLEFTAGPLGGTIDTSTMPNGELFIANVNIAPGVSAMATVQVVSAGTVLGTLTPVCIPEPTTAGLASLAVFGLAAICRLSSP